MPSPSLSSKTVRSWLAARPKNSHKGDFGHVLIVAGSRNMAGAGILAAHGALRSGAGLVTLATVKSRQRVAAAHLRPEAMTLGLPEASSGSISPAAVAKILSYIKARRVTALVMGPGLTRNPQTQSFVRKLLPRLSSQKALAGIILDADGFLALKGTRILEKLKIPAIITPHPGELAAFTGRKIPPTPAGRIEASKKFAKLNKVVCVLKGHRTVISDGQNFYINPAGNAGMARGGSGDVLSGMIGALLGNVRPPDRALKAACAGVYVHGLAGDIAAQEKTQISMTAGDIAEKIPSAFRKIYK